jgi:GDPmannose 4,6-dehydratase
MWRMLQKPKPDDYVVATGEKHSVREFVERSFAELDMQLEWTGANENEKGILKSTGQVVVEVDPRYYRPTEVELLIGDASKARRELGWVPATDFRALVKLMVAADLEMVQRRGF